MNELRPIQFGKYILLDKIATGGMAELHRAKITGVKGFEKLIAIKTILPHLTSEESLIASFIDEAKLAAFLQHTNIVQIYDFGKMEGTYFLAMEYLFGKDLKSVIKKSQLTSIPLTLQDSLYITARVCDGLYYAHNLKDFAGKSLNIIHRDIGPQNVFITYDGQVKIIDFGIAKAANQSTNTQSDLIKGKVAYMSPEQAQGKMIDHRSDIFSIGILLYELITHKRMFEGDNYQIYDKVCRADFEKPENAANEIPENVCEIINKALASDPDDRYQNAEQMANDLDGCISELSFFPTDKTLCLYMKGLFEKEAEEEEMSMRDAAQFDTSEKTDPENRTTITDIQTATIATRNLSIRTNRKYLYGLLAVALILAGGSVALISGKSSFENSRYFGQKNPEHMDTSKQKQNVVPDKNKDERTSPDSGLSDPVKTVSPEFAEGVRLINEKRFKEAVLFFEDIISKDPLKKDAVSGLYIQSMHGQAIDLAIKTPDQARKILLKAIAFLPHDSDGFYHLGRVYTQEKNYSKAIASYEKAIELKTEIPGVFFNLGYIYYAVKKDYLNAEKMYERTVLLGPDFLDEALFNLALAQRKLGKKEDCIKNLGKAISVNPNNKQANILLERLIQERNQKT